MKRPKTIRIYSVRFIKNDTMAKEQNDDRISFDVIYNGKVVGCVDLISGDVLSKNKTEIYIEIKEKYRRQGIAKKVYANIDKIRNGNEPIYAVVNVKNEASMALHKSCGFKERNLIKDNVKYAIFEL
jgi:RimJ/RimL family protein N-acetyltransferase